MLERAADFEIKTKADKKKLFSTVLCFLVKSTSHKFFTENLLIFVYRKSLYEALKPNYFNTRSKQRAETRDLSIIVILSFSSFYNCLKSNLMLK